MLKEPQFFAYLCLVIALIALCGSFAYLGFFLGILVSILISATWLFFIRSNWILGNNIAMLIFLLGVSLATIFEAPRGILLICLLAALSTWDLASLKFQFSTNKNIVDENQLIRTHLVRLVYVLIIGLALSLLSFGLQLELKFWQVFLLGILLLLGLSQVFSFLKRSSNI